MKFTIMALGHSVTLQGRSSEEIERMIASLVELEDELAQNGELVYSEVLADSGALVSSSPGSAPSVTEAQPAISRYWAVKVADRERAIAIAKRVAAATDARVEVQRCLEQSLKP